MNQKARNRQWIGTLLFAALGSVSLAAVEDLPEPINFQAFAVDPNAGGSGAGAIDITITSWTSEEDRAKLREALTQKGSDTLLTTLQDTKRAGFIRATGGGLGWNIQYARKTPLPDGGYRVIVATDRPMSFYERTNQPRSAEYEFMVAEFRIGKDGEGEGKLVPAAKVRFDKGENTIEIENYANEPIQLTKVRELKSKSKEAASEPEDKSRATSPEME